MREFIRSMPEDASIISNRITQLRLQILDRVRWAHLGLPLETQVYLIDEADALRALARRLERQLALLGVKQ